MTTLLDDLRTARRTQGKSITPRLSHYLATLDLCWRADPTATELTFDEWCAQLGSMKPPRERILVTSVRVALVNEAARYVPEEVFYGKGLVKSVKASLPA